jgi:GT2 family glycosyltransferase
MSIDVSVVIVNLNDSQLLDECLASVYEHTRDITFEVIVVDNHSSDDSVVMVKTKYPQVRLIENQQNNRYAIANNQGLKIAKGTYVLYLNADTKLMGNAIKEMADFLSASPEAGGVGCQLVYPGGSHQDSCFRFPSAVNLFYLSCLSRFYWNTPLAGNYLFEGKTAPQSVDFVIGACYMARRELLTQCGGMDEAYYFYGEDSDLCYRMQQIGGQNYYLPKSEKIIHYGGVSSTLNLFDNNQRTKHVRGWKARFLFVKKHYPAWRKVVITIAMGGGFGVNALLYGVAGIKRLSWGYARNNLQIQWEITREVWGVW